MASKNPGEDAFKFDSVSVMEGSNGYRLLTEAEWEYACRAGTTTATYAGALTHQNRGELDPALDRIGWYHPNSAGQTHDIGQKEPNAWGLYDMIGDVYEWCWGCYGNYELLGEVVDGRWCDPKGAEVGAGRVLRGGSWFNDGGEMRAPYL